MSKTEQRVGKAGENLVQRTLYSRGFLIPEKIGTPVRLISLTSRAISMLRRSGISPKGIYRVIFGEKVSGDHRAVLPGGKSVLVESKTILDTDRLIYSKLRDHQPDALTAHAETGAVSLLAWVSSYGVFLMRWPVPGFAPRKSISLEKAQELDISDISELKEMGGKK